LRQQNNTKADGSEEERPRKSDKHQAQVLSEAMNSLSFICVVSSVNIGIGKQYSRTVLNYPLPVLVIVVHVLVAIKRPGGIADSSLN
jgi:hypothetical protein